MKSHFCKAEGTALSYEGECNWCGEKEIEQSEEQAEQSQLADATLEPVAWSQQRKRNLIKHWAFDCDWGDLTEREIDDLELIINAVLNAAPVRTKDPCHPWQDLTDDEIRAVWLKVIDPDGGDEVMALARAVIAADRAKNNLCERTK